MMVLKMLLFLSIYVSIFHYVRRMDSSTFLSTRKAFFCVCRIINDHFMYMQIKHLYTGDHKLM